MPNFLKGMNFFYLQIVIFHAIYEWSIDKKKHMIIYLVYLTVKLGNL